MNQKTILVADDDRLLLAYFTRGLRHAGYTVLNADNGKDAVAIGIEQRPDLAVLDIQMPGMSGIKAAGLLREAAAIPALFLTAHTDKAVVENATRQGALGYLVKPIDPQQLIPSIEMALQRADELQQLKESQASLTDAIHRSRKISMAVGVYMERFQVEEAEAFQVLRNYARSAQQKLVDVAQQMTRNNKTTNELARQIRQSARC